MEQQTTPSNPDIVKANIEVYEDLHGSFRENRDAYLPVMRDAMRPFIRRLHARGAHNVLDVGSGAGVHAQVLSEAGLRVTAIDASASMLQIVKDNVPGAECTVADFWTYQPRHRFDGVVLASFIHLFPKEDLPKVVRRVNSWMNRGAVGWIATVTGESHDGAWFEKEELHGRKKRWRVVYDEVELLTMLHDMGLIVLECVRAPDGIHPDKQWLDAIVHFPGAVE